MSIHFIDVITATNAYNTRLVKAKSKSFIYLYLTTIIYFLSNSISAFPLQGYHFPYDVESPLPMLIPNIHLYVMFIIILYTMKLPLETSMSVIRNDIIV